MLSGFITRLSAWSKTNSKRIRVQKGRKQGRKPRQTGLTEGLPGTGNCRAAFCEGRLPAWLRRDNFLSFAIQRAKKVLFANLLLNHITHPTIARTPYQAWQAGKKQQPSLEPWPLFGKKLSLLWFRRWLPRIINNVDD